jgi:2-aminoadipate transaminase
MEYEKFFSGNALRMKKSEIRELLKLTRKPGIISFAGGLPSPDLFPVEEIKNITRVVLEKEGKMALQYGPTEGDNRLKEELLEILQKEGAYLSNENILIITSSQQGLDLIGKIFINPGDVVMTGKPTYVGAIQAFYSYGAKLAGVELDENGIDCQKLDKKIEQLIRAGQKPRFIYVVPDFQNPSGITLDVDRRWRLVDIAEKYDLIIVEDSPYRQLRFEGEPEPPVIGLNTERVISLFTFSKILLPGFRLGWMVGPKQLIQKATVAKQSVDLCSPPFNQAILAEFIKRGLLQKQIERIVVEYRKKRDFMLEKLKQYMPKIDGLHWTHPKGGLFLWVTLPGHMDAITMFADAVEKKVAYVVGSAFDPDGKDKQTFRINFSYPSMEQIEEGVKRLAQVIKNNNTR